MNDKDEMGNVSDAPMRYDICCPCSFNQEHIVPHSDGGWVSFETYCAVAEQAQAARERADTLLGERDDAQEALDEILDGLDASKTGWAQEIVALKRELAEAVDAATCLSRRLHAIHNNPEYAGVWAVYQIHVGPYSGPQYTDELDALDAFLARHQEPKS